VSKGNVDNLIVCADPAELLEQLEGWRPVEKGLMLSPELRKAAIGEDVSQRG